VNQRDFLRDDIREIVKEELRDASSTTMRAIAKDELEAVVPAHILTCPTGTKVADIARFVERTRGVLILLSATVGVIGSLGIWVLNRTTSRIDDLQKSVTELRVQLGVRSDGPPDPPVEALAKVR